MILVLPFIYRREPILWPFAADVQDKNKKVLSHHFVLFRSNLKNSDIYYSLLINQSLKS